MKKASILVMVIFLLTISIPAIAHAQEVDALQFGVKVIIEGGGELQDAIKGHINSSLRSRGDIVIVDENDGFVIHILALEIKSIGEYPHGVSLTVVA